jgi:hypothetical protein
MNNTRFATFRKIEFVRGLKNKSLLNTTMFFKNGIPIHGGLV